MVSKIAMIVFFLAYGINYFSSFNGAGIICAIAALAAGIALIANS